MPMPPADFRSCFILGLDPPRSNYILEDYFVMQRGFSCGGCEETTGRCEFPVQIIRTGALQFSNIQLKRLHGQIHTNVMQHDEPRVSDVLRWHELALGPSGSTEVYACWSQAAPRSAGSTANAFQHVMPCRQQLSSGRSQRL